MAIQYDRLNKYLKEKGLKRTDLLNVVSSKTLAKLSKNEIITTETIDKICMYLNCQPNDIMEVIQPELRTDKRFTSGKYIALPNSDNTYTAVQRKLFDEMEKTEVISKEKIDEWLRTDPLFRETYYRKKSWNTNKKGI